MSEQLSGLLKVKPENVPNVGDTVTLSYQELTSQKGNQYLKFKRDTAEYGGKPYKVVSAQPKDPDEHGNIAVWIGVDATDTPSEASGSAPNASNGRSGRDEAIDRAVAFKAATEIVCVLVRDGKVAPEDAAGEIERRTAELLPVLRGEDPPTTPVSENGSSETRDTVPATSDDDIPF